MRRAGGREAVAAADGAPEQNGVDVEPRENENEREATDRE
jgi:hypothetical protein